MLYLLNTYPAWVLLLFIMTGLSVISLLSFFLVRRFFPKLLTSEMSPAFGVMGTSYGFLLGFSIAILWQNYTAATNVTAAEAANFSLIINDVQLLNQDDQLKLLKGLKEYITLVKNEEWEAMKWGESAPMAWKSIHDVTDSMRSIHPESPLEKLAYESIYKELGNVVENRSKRIQAIETILPFGVKILLIIGAIFIVYSVSVNDTRNKLNHLMSILMVSFLLAFNLTLAFVLAYPFAGENRVPGKGLIDIIPVRIKLIEKIIKEKKQAELEAKHNSPVESKSPSDH